MHQTPQPLSDDELVLQLEEQNRRAVGYLSDEVTQDQDDNLKRYLGMPYGDEEEGSSNAMSMDVAEVVDWALPDLLEPFISGERKVEFQAQTEADEAWVEQASDLVQHNIMVENHGILLLYDVAKSALIQKIGITKTTWETTEHVEQQTTAGLSILNVQALQVDPEITIESVQSEPTNVTNIDPSVQQAFVDGNAYTVKFKRTVKKGKCKTVAVPPEEFRVTQRAKDIRNIRYCCHETETTRADLISMGFATDVVMSIQSETSQEANRQDTRFRGEDRTDQTTAARLAAQVTLKEEYYRVDANGDGREEMVQVFRVGKTLLQDPEEVDDHPFEMWTPDRIPHRLIGLAIADKVKNTQRIKTVLTRQLLDNVYLANNPRIEVPDDAVSDNTYDDLLKYRIGGLIRTKKPGMLNAINLPDRSGSAMQAIMYMDSVREQQSGVVKNGMALSSEAIDPKSATEARKEDRNEQTRKRLMARMFAETFMVPLFQRVLRCIVKYQDVALTLKLRGRWVEMDPRGWNSSITARASVGLGYANRDEQLLAAKTVAEMQMVAFQNGLAGPEHLYKTAEKVIEAVGWQFPDNYFVNPQTPEGQQALARMAEAKAQDPRAMEAQGKLQLMQLEMQMEAQAAQLRATREIEFEKLKVQAKQAIEERRLDFDIKSEMLRINQEDKLARERMFAEFTLKRQQMAAEAQLERERDEAAHVIGLERARNAGAGQGNGVSPVRFGGKLG